MTTIGVSVFFLTSCLTTLAWAIQAGNRPSLAIYRDAGYDSGTQQAQAAQATWQQAQESLRNRVGATEAISTTLDDGSLASVTYTNEGGTIRIVKDGIMVTPPAPIASGISAGNVSQIAMNFATQIAGIKNSTTANDSEKKQQAEAVIDEAERVVLNESLKLLLPAELTAQLASASVLQQDAVLVDFKTTPQRSPKAIAAQLISSQPNKTLIVINVPPSMAERDVRGHFNLSDQARVEIAHEGNETARVEERIKANEFGKVLAMVEQDTVERIQRLVGGVANVLVVAPAGEITYRAIRDLTGKNV